MKSFIKIAAAIAFALSLFSCHDELVIPDPGFDMSETVLDTVRRDTSSVYSLSFNVKAPNGVRSIQLLNGRNFEVLQEFGEFVNQKNFTFSHTFDFSDCDPEQDSTFIYNIKITTNDNRGYNKSIRVVTMRKSHPQVIGPSDNLNVFGRIFVFDGTIDAGYYSLESVEVALNGQVVKTLGSTELQGTSSYRLYHRLTYDFEADKNYQYTITVKDSNGQEETFSYKLVGSAIKKPVALKLYYMLQNRVAILHYNDKGLVESVVEPYYYYYTAIHYDDEGRVVTALRSSSSNIAPGATPEATKYGSGYGTWYQYNEDGSLKRFAEFNFVTKVGETVHKMLDPFWNRDDLIPESCAVSGLSGTDLEGFITSISGYNDHTMNKYVEYNGVKYISEMHGTNSNVVGPLNYVEDFEEGKMLCTTIPGGSYGGVHPFYGIPSNGWANLESFVPVYNPLYIKDFPITMHWRGIGAISVAIFGVKYAASSVSRILTSHTANQIFSIPYTVRDDGVLKSFGTMDNGIQAAGYNKIYTYYYDDEPESEWRGYVLAGSEERVALMK